MRWTHTQANTIWEHKNNLETFSLIIYDDKKIIQFNKINLKNQKKNIQANSKTQLNSNQTAIKNSN